MRKPMLWYPKAETIVGITFRSRGDFEQGYPMGAVVHFTAGWRSQIPLDSPEEKLKKECLKYAKQSLEGGSKDGFMFFIIDALGQVYQQFPLNKWGYHAGTSYWKGLGKSVSSKLVGIEVQCAGKVTPQKDGKYLTWFKHVISKEEVRYSEAKDNVQEGYYEKYTEAQEKSLTELLLWLEANGDGIFKFNYVLGHDEVAPKRKNDPGAALSMTMPAFRKHLEDISKPEEITPPTKDILEYPVKHEPIVLVPAAPGIIDTAPKESTPNSEIIKIPEQLPEVPPTITVEYPYAKKSFWEKIISWFTKK